MRTVLIYLLALGAVVTAAVLGFPELFGVIAADANGSGARRAAGPSPVIVAPVVNAPFSDVLEALGTVRANESVEMTPNRADHVSAIHFEDGQEVVVGDLIVEMNADEEKGLLAEASAIRDERRTNHERAMELFAGQMTSARELENAAALLAASQARVISLEAAIADRQVRVPFSGTLGLRRVSIGSYVQPATVITTLDDLSVVKLDFTIPEAWLSTVQSGMRIQARSDAWPEDVFPGEVVIIDTRLEASTRSATVRALLPNPDRRLRPGMLLKVTVERGQDTVLQIPEEALIPIGDEQFVLRIDAEDVAHRVPVAVGRRRIGLVEVRRGLEEGDRVIVEGILRARAGDKVNIVATREPKT